MRNQHELGAVGNPLEVGCGTLGIRTLIALAREQAPVAQQEDARSIDERHRPGFFSEGIGGQGLSLQVLVIEFERQGSPQRRQQIARGAIDQIALPTVDQRDHSCALTQAAGAGIKARSIFAAM